MDDREQISGPISREDYCSVLNNRPLLISIRGDIQAIKTQLLAGQYPCSLSKLIKNGNEDIKPKFELPRTKTVDLRQHWNFVQADVPNKNTGFLLRTLEYLFALISLDVDYFEVRILSFIVMQIVRNQKPMQASVSRGSSWPRKVIVFFYASEFFLSDSQSSA